MQGFSTRIAETVTTDFRHFKLVTAILFTDVNGDQYQMPVGAPSDLASVPAAFWPELPPFGEYALEAYLHDGAYQNWLLKSVNGVWVKAALSKPDCDSLFYRAMDMNPNITEAQKEILYNAVAIAGGHSFNEDRG